MVIATSGFSYINYNRIIHSSISPYSVLSTETFRDPTVYSPIRILYALYVINLDNAVSLIKNGATDTYLATINF